MWKASIFSLFPPQYETVDKGHGRIEIRKIWCSSELTGYLTFPHHQQVMRIERIRTTLTGEQPQSEVAFAITSLPVEKAPPTRLLKLNRGHWGIENSLHYVRDVTFDEDRCRIRTNSSPRIMATFRNLSISILRFKGYKNIARALRFYTRKPHLTLQLVGL